MESVKRMEFATLVDSPAPKLFTNAWMFDLMSGYLPAALFFGLLILKLSELIYFINTQSNKPNAEFYLPVSTRISTIVFVGLMVVLCTVRLQPIKKAEGVLPRITAFGGTFLLFLLVVPQNNQPSLLISGISSLLIVSGTCLSIAAIIMLGRSFSIMAEARRLVTTGFYSFVRHPLYLCEEIAIVGVVLQVLSPLNVAIFILQFMLQIQRMKNEEKILQEVFPEYEQYKARTAMLIPKVY